uniref:Uncharacterized protein n=1 Tax=Meloidogyne enterolobii TaxID=390850 RepID=A0A6V7VIB8_MELEN|nr:unnamed protein product [Meloidogyne enterolobii]
MDSGKKEFFGNIPKCIFKFSEELCRNDNSLFCLFCKTCTRILILVSVSGYLRRIRADTDGYPQAF